MAHSPALAEALRKELESLKGASKFKTEKELAGPQGTEITIEGNAVVSFASNNYLGLANHAEIAKAAKEGIDGYGFGLSSVRFLSGTQVIHRELERKLATFLGTEDAILYSTNFMANLGFFASVVNEPLGHTEWNDVVYSDALNHASIIDAFKLCNRERLEKRIYPHKDLVVLRQMLKEDTSKGFRNRIIVTDGVFSMEGTTADISELKALSDEFGALLFVDDAHGIGVLGATGAGTPEETGLHGKMDVLSGTFGKALGGAVGGYLAGRKDLIDFLRQKSRPYMFSNSVPPSVVTASIRALDLLQEVPSLLEKARRNARYFRERLAALGFSLIDGSHPIIPIMLGEAKLTQEMASLLLAESIYVVGLWFPVVPEGQARLRFQVSAAHTEEELDRAVEIIEKVARKLSIL